MGYYCTVPQCTSLAGKTKNVKFHRFPRDTTMADKWNIILKRGKPYTKYSKVCSLHFTQADYNVTTMGQWKTLSKDAVPSQNLPKLNPDGTVMVIRKSRTVKYREGKKEDSEKADKSWQSVMSGHGNHSLLSNGPDTPGPQDVHDNTILAYRLHTLGAIANAIAPAHPLPLPLPLPGAGAGGNKPRKQDAIMQTDPVLNEDDDTQPNNSYSEVSDKSYSSELDQYNQSYPKEYPKDNSPYSKDNSPYPKDDSPYLKEHSPYPKDSSPYLKDNSPYPKDTPQYPRDSTPYTKEYPKEQTPYPRESTPYKEAPIYARESSPYAKESTYKDTSYPKDGTYKDTSYEKDGTTYSKDGTYKDQAYPKDTQYPKDGPAYKDTVYTKDGAYKDTNYHKDGVYQKEDTPYQKSYESKSYEPKDYTKSSEDYIPQTNEEYNKEAEKYALVRKSHNGYDLKEYQKQVLPFQKIPEMYSFDKYNRDGYFQNGYADSAEVLRNQQHNLQVLQEQHRLNENQNFFNENHIKQEIDICSEDDKFLYERSKEQLESSPMYAERRLQHQRILEHLHQQVKQEPDTINGCDNVMQPTGSPYYPSPGHSIAPTPAAAGAGQGGGYYEGVPRPGPELLIAKQNALAAHTQLWQNMKRPFFYSESPHYNAQQLLHRYEDIPRILQ